MSHDKPDDPDAQATITDYLDYTEYFPSDLNRALTLIRKLDEDYLERANKVQELSEQYASLPTHSLQSGVTPQVLRNDISSNLDYAIKARESAYGEAERLNEMVNRYYNRLVGIRTKLLALPKPPSRDPTPVARSPQAARKTPTRITLRLDGARATASTGRSVDKDKKKVHRSRRITVPGEVLPPPNPDSEQEYSESDFESVPPSPLPMPTSRVGGSRSRSHKANRIKLPKAPKDRLPREPKLPGMGTNVHSKVAGISTTNALSMLPKPPPDAQIGSEHAPWMRLTEYEMALLRKRMKKNAIWTPSETMIRRELAAAGRGPESYRKKKAECEEIGEEMTDVDNIATNTPGKPLAPGEISSDSLAATASEDLSNRGTKLHEAKKERRKAMLLASSQETEEAMKRLKNLSSDFKNLFGNANKAPLASPFTPILPKPAAPQIETPSNDKEKKKKKKQKDRDEEGKTVGETTSRKRKLSETTKLEVAPVLAPLLTAASEPVAVPATQTSKKRKTDPSPTKVVKTVTTTLPLASPGPSAPEASSQPTKPVTPTSPAISAPEKPKPSAAKPKATAMSFGTATSSRPRRVSLTLRGPASLVDVDKAKKSGYRAGSRRGSVAALPTTLPRERPRPGTTTPATPATPTTPAPIQTAASRRSKRPPPGTILRDKEGGAAVTIGRREQPRKDKSAVAGPTPGKKGDGKSKGKELQKEEQAARVLIGPNEPRYCICGDVSYGDMIMCDNENCQNEWFHFSCVGMTENPPKRTKWYCPECRVKLKK